MKTVPIWVKSERRFVCRIVSAVVFLLILFKSSDADPDTREGLPDLRLRTPSPGHPEVEADHSLASSSIRSKTTDCRERPRSRVLLLLSYRQTEKMVIDRAQPRPQRRIDLLSTRITSEQGGSRHIG
ncbi:UNVERIFIED_CONTAM: hypothetical protein K2H54_072996 [Gekko kuhli]